MAMLGSCNLNYFRSFHLREELKHSFEKISFIIRMIDYDTCAQNVWRAGTTIHHGVIRTEEVAHRVIHVVIIYTVSRAESK